MAPRGGAGSLEELVQVCIGTRIARSDPHFQHHHPKFFN